MQKTLYWGDQSDVYKVNGLDKSKKIKATSHISFPSNLMNINFVSLIVMYQLTIAV